MEDVPSTLICAATRRELKIKKVLIFLFIYLVCWALSYVIVNQDFNIELLVDYFVLAWTFDGFVRPVYTWILSLLLFLPIVAIYWFVARKKGRDGSYDSNSKEKKGNGE